MKENESLMANILHNTTKKEFDEDEFLMKLREEVVDKFTTDFARIHREIDTIKKTSKLEEV